MTAKSTTSLGAELWSLIRFGGIVMCVHQYVAELTMCSGPSMLPTFNSAGDVVIVNKLNARWRGYKRNDIVVAMSPHKTGQKVCKRVVAVAGDVICYGESGLMIAVPPGHVWLEGDNPRNSTDSRDYGPVPLSVVEGTVVLKVWPLSQFQRYGETSERPRKPLQRCNCDENHTAITCEDDYLSLRTASGVQVLHAALPQDRAPRFLSQARQHQFLQHVLQARMMHKQTMPDNKSSDQANDNNEETDRFTESTDSCER